ncbi:MAG TPA: acyl-CoA thioesterase [Candidatus Latescibacteria bacterium]|nr:acyl-CoA thioesterase [Candidatus Latescibacterota bacterium]
MKAETKILVRYAEVDRMDLVHSSRYLEWFEIGRTELLRAIGLPYRELEDGGVFLPVVEAHVEYIEPVRYDDRLRIVTRGSVQGARLRMDYEVFREGELVARGYTVHACLNRQRRPIRPPKELREALGRGG